MEKKKLEIIRSEPIIDSNLKPFTKMSDPRTLHGVGQEEIERIEKKNKKIPIETKTINTS